MEITVIDDSDHVGWAASATRLGEVYMTDVTSMVTNVLAEAGSTLISRLNILDHGNSNSFQIGTDWISLSTLPQYESDLAKLNGHFTSKGFVHLQHCDIGNNHTLLASLAAIFGVGVIAGTGAHNPVYRFNFGNYERANPDGTVQSNVRRPGSAPPRPYVDPFSNPNKMCCFAAGTLVRCPGGAKRIEDFATGDRVYSYDLERQRVVATRVARPEYHAGEFPIHELQAQSGSTVAVTDTHRFHVTDQGWVPLEAMTSGMPMAGIDGAQQVSQVARHTHTGKAVFNLKVADNSNYFVGEECFLVRDY